jgi:hypothetical protein
MAILNNSNAISSGGYDINNSLRFRSSATAYLNRTPASAGNRKTWTWSGWVKRGAIGFNQRIFRASASGSEGGIQFYSGTNNDGIELYDYTTSYQWVLDTTQLFRDPSAWYHIVLAFDTTQATSANRVKFYVNGNQVTAFSTSTYPSLNYEGAINNNIAHTLGGSDSIFDGYMADINFIDGQALTPSSFGETDTTTGSWKPKAYTGTYGTNGFYLKFSDIATTSGSNAGLGKDFSGNTNYWTTNNISVTAGTTYDAMIDSPTLTSATVANYCVMNPIGGNSSMTLLNGNLNTSATAYSLHRYGTIGVSSGKYYWEASPTAMSGSGNGMVVGISNDIQESGTTFNGIRGYFSNDGKAYTGTSGATYGATWTTNDILGMALDLNAGTLTFYKNNVSQGTAFTGLTGEWFPLIRTDATVTSFINFGQRPFAYTPPSGFVRLNTYNLPDSTIKKGNTVMDATIYTGNSATPRSITNAAGFKPDLVWIKNRSNAYSHNIYDSVRGSGSAYSLQSNTTNSELTNATDTALYGYVSAFNSNGFSTTNGSDPSFSSIWVNQSSQTFVGWQWQAGQGSTSSNTSGSITSTVSVNATAGFSIVTWTANNTTATIGHGLGVKPSLIIVRDRAGSGWEVYSSVLGATKYLQLNSTNAAVTSSTRWNNTEPTSTVFTVTANLNYLTDPILAYCWAEIAGFSKFGSYTGNGSANGPMIYLGFQPKFVMFKDITSAAPWYMWDASRNTSNSITRILNANNSNAEGVGSSGEYLDFLSNGFKLRSDAPALNNSGDNYIYMAFSSNPFKNSNAF